MSVYVDTLRDHAVIKDKRARRLGSMWCHLFADNLDELHVFALKVGLRRAWFQDGKHPHYDLLRARRLAALKVGAIEITTRSWLGRKDD